MKYILATLCVLLLTFQHPLESVWAGFSWIDELVALIGVFGLAWKLLIRRNLEFPGYMLVAAGFLAVFVGAGLAGNVIYRYQSWKSVIIDLYTNVKFFFSIVAGYVACATLEWDVSKKQIVRCGRISAAVVFAVFVLDRIYPIYPGEIRHGIRSVSLFFGHATYLASAMAFLVILLTVFYEKKNLVFMGMCLTVMVFTMRSKAMASAAIFAAVFVFFLVFRKRLNLWYILAAGVICVVVAWPQIRYYFIELGGKSTRSVMHSVAFRIMEDYFPIGTGFGTYASAEAAKNFSPVYELYDFEYLLRFEVNRQWVNFLNDTFWPIIIGQTGVIGTVAYLGTIGSVFYESWKLQRQNLYYFVAVLYGWCHLIICSVAEPAFNNSTAVPIAVVMGLVLCKMGSYSKEKHYV